MRVRRFSDGIVVRVVALGILITVVGTFARFTMLSSSLRDNLEALVSAHLASDAAYVAGDIDEKVRLRRHFLETLARQLPHGLLGKPAELEAWLAERHALSPYFSLGIAVVPLSGQGVIADYPHLNGREHRDFSETIWFRTAVDEARFAIGRPAIGQLSGQGLIVMATPVLDAQKHVVAVVCGATTLDAPGFLNQIQNNSIGRNGGFLLVSPRDQIFVTSTQRAMRLQPTPQPGINPLHDKAMAGWRGTGTTVSASGVEELVAVVGVSSADWFVVARMPASEVYASVADARSLLLKRGIAITSLSFLIFATCLVLMFRPLRDAARRIRQMADSQAPLAPLEIKRLDEVGEVVEGFNFLVARVRENEARMTLLAHRDPLTGLANRLSFQLQAGPTVAMARRQNGRVALMFIDLDGFKLINDQNGHEAGDALLQQVAQRLSDAFRQADMVARFGGDEFVVLLTEVREREQIEALANKIIARISEPYRMGERTYTIGASVGIAFLPDDAEDIESLIAQADAAMYDAKRAGRNCCRFAHRLA